MPFLKTETQILPGPFISRRKGSTNPALLCWSAPRSACRAFPGHPHPNMPPLKASMWEGAGSGSFSDERGGNTRSQFPGTFWCPNSVNCVSLHTGLRTWGAEGVVPQGQGTGQDIRIRGGSGTPLPFDSKGRDAGTSGGSQGGEAAYPEGSSTTSPGSLLPPLSWTWPPACDAHPETVTIPTNCPLRHYPHYIH